MILEKVLMTGWFPRNLRRVYAPSVSNPMQNTLPLNHGHRLSEQAGLARQISLPGESVPLRFPSFPALERTAVMGFNQPSTLPLPAGVTTSMTITRQATYPVWADISNPYYYQTTYQSSFAVKAANTQVTGPVFYDISPSLSGWASATKGTPYVLTTLVGNPGDVPYPIMGRDTGLPGPEFTYIPHQDDFHYAVIGVGASSTAATVRVTVEWEMWASPGQSHPPVDGGIFSYVDILANNWGAATGPNMDLKAHGTWVRPRSISVAYPTFNAASLVPPVYHVVVLATNAINVTYIPAAGTGTWDINEFSSAAPIHMPLVYPNEFDNSMVPWYATRVTAAAALATNISQVLVKGGTVLAGRVSPAQHNLWEVSQNFVASLHPAEKAFLALETGFYTYCPPSTDLLFFTDYSLNTGDSAPNAPIYSLHNDSMYNKVYFTPSGTTVSESLAVTSTWHMEFRTSSSLFQVALCNMTLESLHQAQLTLSQAGYFFENPTHKSAISRVIGFAKQNVPRLVSIVNPTAGRFVKAFTKGQKRRPPAPKPKFIQPKPGPSKPPATSAKRSGYGGGRRKPNPSMPSMRGAKAVRYEY